jgi:hypothetical protein
LSKRALLGEITCDFNRTPFKQIVITGGKEQSGEVRADVGIAATGNTKISKVILTLTEQLIKFYVQYSA